MTNPEDAVNLRSIFAGYDLQKCLDIMKLFLKRYPTLSIVIGILAAFYVVPIAVYIAFSVGAFVLTFVGFLIILGGILLVGFLVLASVLATITIIVLFVCSLTCVLYAAYRQLHHISDALTTLDEAARRDRAHIKAELSQ